MQYRRVDIQGACYFFTINLADRKSSLLVDEVNKLRDIINKVKKKHSFKIDALVIMAEHFIRDEYDFKTHVDYIHYNPVKHGYVRIASDWRFSTIHKYIELGIYDNN